jgi:hypothetical protein
MMVWKICVPKINVGMCDKDPILQRYHLGLGPWIKSGWNKKAICQVVRIMWYISLGHWVIECDNWDVHDETIGTSSDPTSYAKPFGSNYIKWRGAQGSEQQLQLNYHHPCKFVIW